MVAHFALLLPVRVILFSIHNRWTQRDYTYQIDDFMDLMIVTCLGIWIYCYYAWKDIVLDEE